MCIIGEDHVLASQSRYTGYGRVEELDSTTKKGERGKEKVGRGEKRNMSGGSSQTSMTAPSKMKGKQVEPELVGFLRLS